MSGVISGVSMLCVLVSGLGLLSISVIFLKKEVDRKVWLHGVPVALRNDM